MLCGLGETQNAIQLPGFFFLWLCHPYPLIWEYGVKNYVTDHRTANTVDGLRESTPVLKIHGCY